MAIADALHGCVALLGEHVDNPSSAGDDSGALPATEVIAILSDAGVDVIATVTGRDRTLRDAGALIGAYRNAGVTAIHCVTGDHPAAVGIDRPARFGAEAITLIAAATDSGCPATVGESPASPGTPPGTTCAQTSRRRRAVRTQSRRRGDRSRHVRRRV